MTDSLGDILKHKKLSEPPEIKQIKAYSQDLLNTIPEVKISGSTYTIWLPNASAANTLRLNIYPLQKQVGMDKKIYIRIKQ